MDIMIDLLFLNLLYSNILLKNYEYLVITNRLRFKPASIYGPLLWYGLDHY